MRHAVPPRRGSSARCLALLAALAGTGAAAQTAFRFNDLDLRDPHVYVNFIGCRDVTDTPLVHEFSTWKTEFWLTGAGSSVVDDDNGRGGGETTAATRSSR